MSSSLSRALLLGRSVPGDELGHVQDQAAAGAGGARLRRAAVAGRGPGAVAVELLGAEVPADGAAGAGAPVARPGPRSGSGRRSPPARSGPVRKSSRSRLRGSRRLVVADRAGGGWRRRSRSGSRSPSPRPPRDMSSSTLAPKMMLASGWAASRTISAASLASISERSGPPVIESSSECAPSTEVSSSGEETAFSAASRARCSPTPMPMPRIASPGLDHGRADVGEVEVDQARAA